METSLIALSLSDLLGTLNKMKWLQIHSGKKSKKYAIYHWEYA